jgi:FG-GAP-like repeat
MKSRLILIVIVLALMAWAQSEARIAWKHLSTKNGDLPLPNSGTQETSATVFDIDKDGVNDFVITERTAAPAVVWYRRGANGWTRYVIEPEPLRIEAGSTFMDVDGDGDLDFIAGGDWKSNEVWWWENPYPNFDPKIGWKRHLIKKSGGAKHHDSATGDFFGDGKKELVFWNQDSHKLLMAQIPADPRNAGLWPLTEIYSYSVSSQPEQRGKAASFKGINEHEGLAVGDVDGDGKLDIVAGGIWFRNLGGAKFEPNVIDAGYAFSRAAAGHLLTGEKREQVVLVIGDGEGPLMWYDLVKGTWEAHKIADIKYGHNIQLIDFNHDGNLDIFTAEQRLNCQNPDSKIYLFLGDGKGNFEPTAVATGLDSHESKVADLNGDGRLDILSKPYNCGTPGLDILLNEGEQK